MYLFCIKLTHVSDSGPFLYKKGILILCLFCAYFVPKKCAYFVLFFGMGWKQDFLPPKKAKAMISAGKVMACSTTLKRITLSPEPEPTTWSPSPETRRMLFHQDNALVQTSTWLLSRNVDSNLLNTHSIQLTAPLTTFLPDYAKSSLAAVILALMMMLWMLLTTS